MTDDAPKGSQSEPASQTPPAPTKTVSAPADAKDAPKDVKAAEKEAPKPKSDKAPEKKKVKSDAKPAPKAKAEATAKPAVKTEKAPASKKAKPAEKPTAKPKPAAKPKPVPAPVALPPTGISGQFRTRLRHFMILVTFVIFVVAPSFVVYSYLTERAADQYASTVGFVVRQADSAGPSGGGLLGSLASLGSANNSDSDILYEFIKSQQMIESVDKNLDLRAIYNLPDNDPVFTLGADSSIEDLMWYWSWAVNVFYDPGTGLIELRVLAFTAEDARNIALEISKQSDALINELSAISREDTTRYAREELDKAVDRLRETRQTLTAFRNSSQIVDPTADVQGRMGLLNYLQQQLADTMIEQDLLRDQARDDDPRLQQSQRRIAVIQERIDEERQKIGLGDTGTGEAAAELVGKYEGLIVDREFAEQAYVKALSNYDSAVAEANRTSRYLAEYIKPTTSQEAQYPQRYLIVAILALFLFLIWFILVLIYYSIKDRR